ncbi:hypothetical protein ACIRRA_43350 [Nocardia sp. NPDC101769]|uniref:hypothetical protein n=1 Tax=Nocardia sp. NPDC101769 TaxID=3364333 RepID=UPI0037F14624
MTRPEPDATTAPSPDTAPAGGPASRPRKPSPLLRLVGASGDPVVDAADELVDRYMAAADADNTTRTYASAWKRFADWCAATGHTALPAEPRTVARYLAVAADDTACPIAKETFTVWVAAIARVHSDARLPDPTADATVRRTVRGIRRTRTQAGETSSQAPALTLAPLQDVLTHIHGHARTWRQQVAARRDIAALVLMYAAGLRRSEALGLQLGDLSVVEGPDPQQPRLRIRLRGSKTSQDAVEYLYLQRGTGDALWCPWCALIRWQAVLTAADEAAAAARARLRAAGHPDTDLDTGEAAARIRDGASIAVQRLLRGDATDPHRHRCTGDWPAPHRARAQLFRPVSGGGLPHDPRAALTGQALGRMITARAQAAGAGAARGHSLRAGIATWMYDNGATDAEVMAKGRWKRVETAQRYDRHRAQRSASAPTGL